MNRNVQSQYLRIEMAFIYLFAALLAVTCMLTACQASPAAGAPAKMPTAELNEAALSDYELIFGEEPGKQGAAKTEFTVRKYGLRRP